MLQNQRLDLETYLTYVGKTEEEFQDELRPVAEDRLNRMLVVRKLAQEEGLEVSTEEIQAEIESIVSTSSEENVGAMLRALNSEGTRESIRSSLLNQKVMARLVEIVQGLESGAEEEEGPDTEQPENEEETPATEASGEEAPPEAAGDNPTSEADPPDAEGRNEGA